MYYFFMEYTDIYVVILRAATMVDINHPPILEMAPIF